MWKLFLALFATFAASAASAAVLLDAPGGNYAEMVQNGHQADGSSLTLVSQGGYEVEFSADGVIHVNGAGFAQQDGPYSFIEIDPLDVGFSRLGLSIRPDLALAGLNGNPTVTFDLTVSFLGGQPSQVLQGTLPNNGKIDVWAEGPEVLDSIRISNISTIVATTTGRGRNRVTTFTDTPLQLEGVRHVSFDPVPIAPPSFLSALAITPVPEPATWGLLLTGFFSLGGLLRWRRARDRADRATAVSSN